MTLTKEQVDAARHQIEHEYDGYAGPHDEALWNAHEALAVYERMMTLRQQWYDAKIKPSADGMWREFISALEG